jgi:hypothetical protein
MAKWHVGYCPRVNCDLETEDAGREIACFRVFPKGEPERWIVETNPDLPRGVQEEMALVIADALSKFLGV